MKKKILYILPLICIITLACQTSNLSVSRYEHKDIAYNNRAENRPIYAINGDYDINSEASSLEKNKKEELPENIKYLDMSAGSDSKNTETRNHSKNPIAQSSKKIILSHQENTNSTSDKMETFHSEDTIISSLSVSLDTLNLNIDSLSTSFIQNRKSIKLAALKHFEYKAKADSFINTRKIEVESSVEVKLNSHFYDIVVFALFLVFFILISIFLIKKVR